MKLIKKVYRKEGNKVTEATKVVDSKDEVITNPHSPDYGKKYSETASYQLLHLKGTPSTPAAPVEDRAKKVQEIIERGKRRYAANHKSTIKEDVLFKTDKQKADDEIVKTYEVIGHLPDTVQSEIDLSSTELTPEEYAYIMEQPAKNQMSKGETYLVAKESYYISQDSDGKVYVLSVDPKSKLRDEYPSLLVKGGTPLPQPANCQLRIHGSKLAPPVHLTKEEFKNILNTKPSFQSLCSAYRLFDNPLKVQLNLNSPTVLF